MELPSSEWINFGNIVIGIGTFALAIVLGATGIVSARKARKIHIADKRQEWVSSFRNYISEVLTLQNHHSLIIENCSVEELEVLLKDLNMASNKIRFMFDSSDERRDRLEVLFADISKDFANKNYRDLQKKQYQIIKITDEIISKQRKKIVELDDTEPII
ncbi:hypothetical protein NQT66_13210 [Cellulophaga baltica]|uniref:hypothetical protein n=1 Tax=Cellulophaga baltica TaxID=76594 RepID=UPI00214759DE|nr:hypothetical protein [Cellulophaga baltica]MCR1025775.1 hypothetical protein [Cellulophaga baltica]